MLFRCWLRIKETIQSMRLLVSSLIPARNRFNRSQEVALAGYRTFDAIIVHTFVRSVILLSCHQTKPKGIFYA